MSRTMTRRYYNLWPILALLPSTILAADVNTDDLFQLSIEELMNVDVTVASLFDTTELDAPSSVSVIKENDWQRRGARKMVDAVSHLPTAVVLPVATGTETMAIRGYARLNVTGTAVLWDGVPLNDLFTGSSLFVTPNINLGTLNEIQMVQGPGSALYGSDAFHGVLALHGFESDRDIQNAQGRVASNGYFDAATHFSTQAYDSTRANLALAANGQPNQHRDFSYEDPDTHETRTGERANEYDAETAMVKLASDPTQPFSYHAGFYAHHYDAEGFQGLGTRPAGTQDLSGQESDFAMTQLGVARNWSPQQSMELNAYYWRTNNEFFLYNQEKPVDPIIGTRLPISQHRVGAQTIYRDALASTRWAISLGGEQLGIDDARAKVYSEQGVLLNDMEHPIEGTARDIQYLTLEAQTPWADGRWRLVYGGRFDHYSDVGNHTSPRLGLIYRPQPDTAIKLLYGNAFRAPTAVELYGSPGTVEGNPDLKPEVIDTYELMWLKQATDWRAQIELFQSHWQNAIVIVDNPNPPPQLHPINHGNNNARGVAGQYFYEAMPWITEFGAAYVTSENGATGDADGMFPKVIINTGLGYTFTQFDSRVYLNQRLQFDTEDVSADTAGFPAQKLPTYWRIDLTATKQFNKQFDLSISARNLLNRNNALPAANGSRGGVPDETLSVDLGARYTF